MRKVLPRPAKPPKAHPRNPEICHRAAMMLKVALLLAARVRWRVAGGATAAAVDVDQDVVPAVAEAVGDRVAPVVAAVGVGAVAEAMVAAEGGVAAMAVVAAVTVAEECPVKAIHRAEDIRFYVRRQSAERDCFRVMRVARRTAYEDRCADAFSGNVRRAAG